MISCNNWILNWSCLLQRSLITTIMGLIDNITDDKPSKQKMTRQQVIDIICSSSNLMDERLNEKAIHQGYEQFKVEKPAKELTVMAEKQYTLVPTLPRGNAYGA